ncbi:LexA family protein [Vibrio sp. YQ_11]|uniref:LexA family protein n=1 Tax=unclassified Vibrio TaxID=2614977 RepID=UPI00370C45A5
MSFLSKNLLSIMRAKGITQAELAKSSGVSQVTISHLVSGKSTSSRKLPEIAKALGVTTETLTSNARADISLEDAKPPVNYYPLISYVEAGNFACIDQTFESYEYYPASKVCSSSTFALRIKGESMEPRFMEGDIIFVDPEQAYSNGDYVVARINGSDEATFKQYREVEGKKYLHALNSEFPLDMRFQELTKDSVIVGKVVAVYKEF